MSKIGNKYPIGAFKANCFIKCYENTLSSAVSSVTISGLDGNTDEEYKLIIRAVGGAANYPDMNIRFNNDSGANYGHQRLRGSGTSVLASRLTGQTASDIFALGNSGERHQSKHHIYAKSGFVRTIISEVSMDIYGTTIENIMLVGQVWNNTSDNLTSINLVNTLDGGNAFGIGTYITLYKKIKRT